MNFRFHCVFLNSMVLIPFLHSICLVIFSTNIITTVVVTFKRIPFMIKPRCEVNSSILIYPFMSNFIDVKLFDHNSLPIANDYVYIRCFITFFGHRLMLPWFQYGAIYNFSRERSLQVTSQFTFYCLRK